VPIGAVGVCIALVTTSFCTCMSHTSCHISPTYTPSILPLPPLLRHPRRLILLHPMDNKHRNSRPLVLAQPRSRHRPRHNSRRLRRRLVPHNVHATRYTHRLRMDHPVFRTPQYSLLLRRHSPPQNSSATQHTSSARTRLARLPRHTLLPHHVGDLHTRLGRPRAARIHHHLRLSPRPRLHSTTHPCYTKRSIYLRSRSSWPYCRSHRTLQCHDLVLNNLYGFDFRAVVPAWIKRAGSRRFRDYIWFL
jgi:hypothetical protein